MRLHQESQQRFAVLKKALSSYNLFTMKKNAPLAFRISDELKKTLQQIANREARSISQICEILLTIGTEAYGREGPRYLQAYLKGHKES
jgi:hypothetical protein